MKKNIGLFLKGIVLGISFIIPGVSGGTLAVLLGIYEDIIEAASNFYKSFAKFKKYFMFLLPIMLGIVFAVGVCAKIIKLGLQEAPIATVLIFLGLIIGGLPKLFKEVGEKPKGKEYLLMLIGIVIVLGMFFLDSGSQASLTGNGVLSKITLFFVGMLASATMVVPGVSGSFTLMLIGYYEPILEVINNITSFNNVLDNVLILIPFLVGAVVGIIIIAKLIEYALKKYPRTTYFVILGFVLASIISVIYQVFQFEFNMLHFIIGIIFMIIDAIFVYKVFEK